MKIELKNIHYIQQLSEETNAFSADIYIEGIKAGTASNRGHGGPTGYYPLNDKGRQLIHDAEEYCKKLPPEKFEAGGKEHELKMDLEQYIDNLLHAHLVEKDTRRFRRKVSKAMQQHLVFGVPDKSFRALRLTVPIEMLLVHPNGKDILKDILTRRIVPELKIGERVLNANIPEEVFKNAGLRSDQYVEQKNETASKKQVKGKGRKL